MTKEIGGFDSRYLARLASVRADGGYVYDLGSAANPSWQSLRPYDSNPSYPSRLVSRWSLQMTLRYEF